MARQRFLLVLGQQVGARMKPPWPGPGRPLPGHPPSGAWVAWRLLGSNHREVARSAAVYADPDACLTAIQRMRAGLSAGHGEVAVDALGGLWGWSLLVDGDPAAVASRLYHRQRECEYSWQVFLNVAPTATVVTALPTQRGLFPTTVVTTE